MPMPSRCDLLIRGAGVFSVHTGEILPADVVVTGDLIRAVAARACGSRPSASWTPTG
ncbi:hypothetical protein SAZ11_12525 [Streptomyces sp. FXJ1.4098]|nr:hypothetical protein [Streptomyces sp. FXJ1.4098]